MKTSSEVTADKLRGGFYSPQPLVQVCLDRVQSLVTSEGQLCWLEPSAGDGAFLAGLSGHALGMRTAGLTAVEIVASEAAACRERLASARFKAEVFNESVLGWALRNRQRYDVAVGNPPFVRFQFVADSERQHALALGERHGAEFKGVSNLWLPVLVAALGALKPGGVFAFIIPAECFTGISGHEVREWLLYHAHSLNVDLFAPGSFPGVLQEVVVLSGRMTDEEEPTRDLHLREHTAHRSRQWTHSSIGRFRTWTRFLLSPKQVQSLETATNLEAVTPLGHVARFEVATVTGANGFFCVPDSAVDAYALRPWARPLLPRTRHAPGLVYTEADHNDVVAADLSAYLLDFSQDRPNPRERKMPKAYLEMGEDDELDLRFKCRIRTPWFRVPVVAPGVMLLAKRSHLFPRVVVNDAGVVTTDTIYRGRLLPAASMTARGFAAGFHNSLTLLTAEVEGRSFGGGVLELVPSEISRLAVPLPENMDEEFDRLDWVCRSAGGENSEGLVDETDQLIVKKTPGLTTEVMGELHEALAVLRGLRTARN